MKTYKIFINYGTTEEFETLSKLTFKGRKKAMYACKNGIKLPSGKVATFPYRCIMTEELWNKKQ